MRLKKSILAMLIVISLLLTMVQPVFADKFWDLHNLGESRYKNGDLIGAIDAWQQIVNMYSGNNSSDALTRSAVYSTKIADAYSSMQWNGEAYGAYKNVEYYWNALGKPESALGPNRIANRLETDLNVYAKVPAQKLSNLAKYEPSSGIYFGAPFDNDPLINGDLTKVQSVYGKKHTAFLMYITWGNPIYQNMADTTKRLGSALQVAWEPKADMSGISYSDASNFAKQLKALGIPVFLRFACEMNEGSIPWSQNSPTVYKQKFQLVASVMHSEAPNVAMVWAPNYVPQEKIDSFYPGDEAVDWVGINGYTDRYFVNNPNIGSLMEDIYYQGYNANPMDRFEYIYNTYSSRKPIFIAETGVANYFSNTGENLSQWGENNIRRLYGNIPLVYPRVKAIFYFNVDSNKAPQLNLKQNYGLSRYSNVMNAYKESIQSDYYLSTVGTEAGLKYSSLQDTSLAKGTVELSSYVKLIDPYVSKVEYWVDGKKKATSTKIPFKANVDLSGLTPGQHILRVDAFSGSGWLNARKMYTINVGTSNITFSTDGAKYVPRHKYLSDINNHWAKSQIERLISMWSVEGYSEGVFLPERAITRAEFYKVLSNSLGVGLQLNTNTLTDIPSDHWAKGLLEGAVELGIIDKAKYPNGIKPDEPITRAEMATWSVRALNGGQKVAPTETSFADNSSIPTEYKGYINSAYSYGIIDGFEDKTFRTGATATRAQAVSIIIRAVDYQNSVN